MSDDLQARLWADNPATECPFGLRHLRPIRKVHKPRWPITAPTTDPPSATFHPKTHTRFNCRTSPLFLRKWRGLRTKGPGWRCKRDKAIDEAFRYLGWKE